MNSILNLEKFNLDDPNNIITNDKNFWNNMISIYLKLRILCLRVKI